MTVDEVKGFLEGFRIEALAGMNPDFQWLPMALLVSFIVLIIYGLILAIARAFNFQELERNSKSEIMNAFATALMAIFLVGLLMEAEGLMISTFLCGGSGCISLECGGKLKPMTEVTDSLDLLSCRLRQKAMDFSNIQAEVTDAAGGPLNMLNIYFAMVGIPIFQGNYVGSWFKEAEQYRLINMTLTNLLVGINALIVCIDYVKKTMLSFWLPLGMILRAFVFTRAIGAFLMAIAIGFFFIFPLVYIVTDPAYVKPAFKAPVKPPGLENPLCYPTFSGLIFTLQTSSAGGSSGGAGPLSLDQLRSDISIIYTSVILQPFVALAITLMIVRFMMYVLGGETQDILRAVARVV